MNQGNKRSYEKLKYIFNQRHPRTCLDCQPETTLKVLTKFMVIVPEPFVGIFNRLSGVGPQSELFVSSTFFQPQIVDVGLQTFELLFGIDHDKRRLTEVNITVDSIN